jgi:hypothetical protein
MSHDFPRMLRVRQNFPRSPSVDVRATLQREFEKLLSGIHPGARIAVAVGSRGITELAEIVFAVLILLKDAGTQPFIVPAMGSHGGATAEGQCEVLASYGITETAMGVPIRASMDVDQIGVSADGVPVFCSTDAFAASGIVLVNRIKPHTDFSGTLGSGIVKMSVIGLGKHAGAAAMHAAATRLGYERVIWGMGRVMLAGAPILGGVAILENQRHELAKLSVLARDEIEAAEGELLVEARALMPRLPFDEIDLLIVDQIGKNISGSGMDPNVTERWVHGYTSSLMREGRPSPFIRRIFVRGLTAETHGNAIGIGLADVTTSRLVRAMDQRATFINALTALTPQCAKIPIHFESDRDAIRAVLKSLALSDPEDARAVHILDTLSLGELRISESLFEEVKRRPDLVVEGEPETMEFDKNGDLRLDALSRKSGVD